MSLEERDDIKWLEAQVRLFDETIRQTLTYQKPTSNAVVVLTRARDRMVRILGYLKNAC